MNPRTRGRLIAFVVVVVALYFAMKYSMLPPGEVARIKDKVEQGNQEQITTGNEESTSTPPAVISFEQFVTDLPTLAFSVEIDKYFIPGSETIFRERLASLGNDPLEVAKGLFALQDVVYQDQQRHDEAMAVFSFTASNAMSRATSVKETDPGYLWTYMISMELHHHAWLIKEATFHSPEQQ